MESGQASKEETKRQDTTYDDKQLEWVVKPEEYDDYVLVSNMIDGESRYGIIKLTGR